jgi:hypothetical protein
VTKSARASLQIPNLVIDAPSSAIVECRQTNIKDVTFVESFFLRCAKVWLCFCVAVEKLGKVFNTSVRLVTIRVAFHFHSYTRVFVRDRRYTLEERLFTLTKFTLLYFAMVSLLQGL